MAGASAAALSKEEGRSHAKNHEAHLEPLEDFSTAVSTVCESSESQALFRNQIDSLKEQLLLDPGLLSSNFVGSTDFPLRDCGKVLGSTFAHNTLGDLAHLSQSWNSIGNCRQQQILAGHQDVDKAFSTQYSEHYALQFSDPIQQDFNASLYQFRGQEALEMGSYGQAIEDFTKAIELNPSNHQVYLDRATAHLEEGNYYNSMQDYQEYIAKSPLDF